MAARKCRHLANRLRTRRSHRSSRIFAPRTGPRLRRLRRLRTESRFYGHVGNSLRSEYAAITLDFLRGPRGLYVVVGKLHCRPPIDLRQFADQADGIEA